MSKILNFADLTFFNPLIRRYHRSDDNKITEVYNKTCDFGFEIKQVTNGIWEFQHEDYEEKAEEYIMKLEHSIEARFG